VSKDLTPNPWGHLREYTSARIALGRCGVSLPTGEHLAFQLSHAMARDAVNLPLDRDALKGALMDGLSLSGETEPILLQSAAADRREYLVRPDLGRRLCGESRELLRERAPFVKPADVALVIGDGLSARAMETNTLPFLEEFLPLLGGLKLTAAPLSLVSQCRVACGDEVAFLLGAKMAVILIGERPGLSSPDSMGIYLTWNPRPGETTDSDRNCLSNIRPAGLGYREAASKLAYLIGKAFRHGLTGISLKDDQGEGERRPMVPDSP